MRVPQFILDATAATYGTPEVSPAEEDSAKNRQSGQKAQMDDGEYAVGFQPRASMYPDQ